MINVTLTINGNVHTLSIEPRESLADVIRDRLGLTGTHLGCEHGACGACTVEINGQATRSCNILGVMCDGRHITTIEGLAEDPVGEILRRHFHEQHALQCGFCTPGMLMMARDLLLRSSLLNEADVRKGLSGHICRCTGYSGIVKAVLAASRDLHLNNVDDETSGSRTNCETSAA